jgi:hypothetical protein
MYFYAIPKGICANLKEKRGGRRTRGREYKKEV